LQIFLTSEFPSYQINSTNLFIFIFYTHERSISYSLCTKRHIYYQIRPGRTLTDWKKGVYGLDCILNQVLDKESMELIGQSLGPI